MKVKYVSKNIRNKKMKGFTVAQGSCADMKYIYIALERKQSKKKSHAVKIVKLKIDSLKVVKISKPLQIGHANDMCIVNGVLYITHSDGANVIHRVDADTLIKGKDIKTKFLANAITNFGTDLYIREMESNKIHVGSVSNDTFVERKVFKRKETFKTSQGMCMYNYNHLVCCYSTLQSSDKNFIARFDLEGNLIKKQKIKVKGELESCFVIGMTLYFVVHRKDKKGNTVRCRTQIVKEIR